MRVASYNIRKAVGLDWRRDPDRIVDVLAEINADIIVLQEADRRVGTRAGVLPLDRLETEFDYIMTDVFPASAQPWLARERDTGAITLCRSYPGEDRATDTGAARGGFGAAGATAA